MTDWKMPTIDQLLTLTNNVCTNPATYAPFELHPNQKYWSTSTQRVRGRTRTQTFNSANGQMYLDTDGRPTPFLVLCVHDASPTPANCPAGSSKDGYTLTATLNHNATRSVTKTQNGTPTNGSTNYTATATCDNGTLNISGESSTVTCNSGYTQNGNTCTPIVVPPSNCTTQTVQGYRVDMLYHNGTRTVYKSFPGSPPNGTTNYTATAKCNNGTITITGEQ